MSDMRVANTIANQMGGVGRLQAMVGAREFLGSDDSLQFSFKGSRKVNKCRVVLDFASDTYTFELWHYNRRTFDMVKKYSLAGAYCDMLIDLFESETGLYLRL